MDPLPPQYIPDVFPSPSLTRVFEGRINYHDIPLHLASFAFV